MLFLGEQLLRLLVLVFDVQELEDMEAFLSNRFPLLLVLPLQVDDPVFDNLLLLLAGNAILLLFLQQLVRCGFG